MTKRKIVAVGHSHLVNLLDSYEKSKDRAQMDVEFIQLWQSEYAPQLAWEAGVATYNPAIAAEVVKAVTDRGAEAVIISILGAEHYIWSIQGRKRPFDVVLPFAPDLPRDEGVEVIPYGMIRQFFETALDMYFGLAVHIALQVKCPVIQILPPPPYSDPSRLETHSPAQLSEIVAEHGAPSLGVRYKLWLLWCDVARSIAVGSKIIVLNPPERTVDENGLLREEYFHTDAVHANALYGDCVFEQIDSTLASLTPMTAKPMHPYKRLPRQAFWKQSVAGLPVSEVDPVGSAKFTLSRVDKVATAGSCFAQHIARHLSGAGFNYIVTEQAHPLVADVADSKYNYGLYTARYANIYTTRQMAQLLKRAYGLFQPIDDMWLNDDGTVLDPFRPEIQPGGFATVDEFQADRVSHFAAVRAMVEQLDCFVFTLGLTESWQARADGAVYPLCPGTAGGVFNQEEHLFHNMTVAETLSDLAEIREFILKRNPKAKFILTVSPVPLVATISNDHALTATTFSKSILRAAAGEFANQHDDVAYFPSYEIVTGNFNRGLYFADDLRSVREDGVAHVMRLFLKHYGAVEGTNSEIAADEPVKVAPDPTKDEPTLHDLVHVVCEEEALSRFAS